MVTILEAKATQIDVIVDLLQAQLGEHSQSKSLYCRGEVEPTVFEKIFPKVNFSPADKVNA